MLNDLPSFYPFHGIKLIDSISLQEWIMEQWDKSYYITSIAGSDNGGSLVVMSKGLNANKVDLYVDDYFFY